MVLFLSGTTRSDASHAVAADIYYTWITGNTYIFRVYFYRDCSGIAAPSSVLLQMQAPSCGQTLGLVLSQNSVIEVPPICNMGTSTCNGGSVFGVKEHLYSAITTLPANCTDWTFSYQLCCRNYGIANIVNPGSMNQFFFATLNNTVYPNNISMRFNEKPIPFRCIDTPFCMDFSASDADGDSLTYALVTPQTGVSSYVSFMSGYSVTNPISSSPAMTFDTQTGQACLWPVFQGLYSMAVRGTEYRNGIVVGSVQRDVQVNMVPCPCLFPLPVQITRFEGRRMGSYNLLQWTTASEKNNEQFIVQRSADGEHFQAVGKVEGAGTSTQTVDYLFRDYLTGNDDMYYRLEQVDYDGKSSFSETILVRGGIVDGGVRLYPAPFRDAVRIELSDPDPGDYVITLRTGAGMLVRTWRLRKPEGTYEEALHVDVETGFYVIEVRGPHGLSVLRTSGGS